MKKIITLWLSAHLLLLNAQPALAQLTSNKLALVNKGLQNSSRLATSAPAALTQRLSAAAMTRLQLANTQQYRSWLDPNSSLSPAQQLVSFPNAQQRALLLRTDFTTLAFKHQVGPQEFGQAVSFYRTHIKNITAHSLQQPNVELAADIACLGLFGNSEDAGLIFTAAQKSIKTASEALITAAAARALLRLESYDLLQQLAQQSTTQPLLWQGIGTYLQDHHIPVQLAQQPRQAVDLSSYQDALQKLGPLNTMAVNPSMEATILYMNAGKEAPSLTRSVVPVHTSATQKIEPKEVGAPITPLMLSANIRPSTASAINNGQSGQEPAWLPKLKQPAWLERFKPATADASLWTQRISLYLTAFSIGLEIGTPIMASLKTALSLPLQLAILITAATYSPYLFGSFAANWLKGKIGRKNTINTGLALMGGSFALGATALGLDGSFLAWDNQLVHFFSILGALTVASTGSVFIHNAVGPVMTEISKHTNDLVRQKRGTYIELSRSIGMMGSFAFPFIATAWLGMDWSAPFLLALPFVGVSALGLNLAKIPNSKPAVLPAPKLPQSPVMDGTRKSRKALRWKDSIFNNSYVRLLREEPGVGNFITALFAMNAVEVAINSGFLFMLPQLTKNPSTQYLFGMAQYAVAFLLGRYLAGHFLKWFPKHSISAATLLAGISSAASLGVANNVYALTAALFTAELGISTAFTLSFARTAKNHTTQDRITSLIMASAISCAIGPVILTQVANALMKTGVAEIDATVASLIGIPTLLSFLSVKLFYNMEGGKGLWASFKSQLQAVWQKIQRLLSK